jgi:hypothetical protein
MKQGPSNYRYAKHINGLTRYGAITIEIVPSENGSHITDKCEWKTLKESYQNFSELGELKLWKQSALNTLKRCLVMKCFPENCDVILHDVVGTYVDTLPSHIGAACVIGLFDYFEKPLSEHNLKILDTFVGENSQPDILPDYDQLGTLFL